MRLNTLLLLGALAGALVGGMLLWDALVTTDEERLQTFVDTVTGTMEPATVTEGLTWVDPDAQPLEVEARGMGKLYRSGDADELQRDAREQLRPFMGDTLRALREAIDVDGDQAAVELKLLTNRGLVQARFRFVKRRERWLLEKAWVR